MLVNKRVKLSKASQKDTIVTLRTEELGVKGATQDSLFNVQFLVGKVFVTVLFRSNRADGSTLVAPLEAMPRSIKAPAVGKPTTVSVIHVRRVGQSSVNTADNSNATNA